MSKIVYTVKEVAEMLAIGMPAAYQLARSEGFPHIKVGKRVVIPIEAFHAWVQAQSQNNSIERGVRVG